MIVVGITHAKGVSKKTGEPYDSYVLHTVFRRPSTGNVETDKIWISPQEYDRSKVAAGDQIDVDRYGGVRIIDHAGELIKELIELV